MPCGPGLYGFATEPLRVSAHSGNDPYRKGRETLPPCGGRFGLVILRLLHAGLSDALQWHCGEPQLRISATIQPIAKNRNRSASI